MTEKNEWLIQHAHQRAIMNHYEHATELPYEIDIELERVQRGSLPGRHTTGVSSPVWHPVRVLTRCHTSRKIARGPQFVSVLIYDVELVSLRMSTVRHAQKLQTELISTIFKALGCCASQYYLNCERVQRLLAKPEKRERVLCGKPILIRKNTRVPKENWVVGATNKTVIISGDAMYTQSFFPEIGIVAVSELISREFIEEHSIQRG